MASIGQWKNYQIFSIIMLDTNDSEEIEQKWLQNTFLPNLFTRLLFD